MVPKEKLCHIDENIKNRNPFEIVVEDGITLIYDREELYLYIADSSVLSNHHISNAKEEIEDFLSYILSELSVETISNFERQPTPAPSFLYRVRLAEPSISNSGDLSRNK